MLWAKLKAADTGKRLSFLASYSNLTSQATFTFTNVDFGIPASDRTIIVVANARGTSAANLNSATIDGVSSYVVGSSTTSAPAHVISRNISSGTTGTISLNYSGALSSGCAVAVYACYGLTSYIPKDSDAAVFTSGLSNNRAVSTNSGDVILSGLLLSSSQSVTWSNVAQDATKAINDGRNVYFASSDNAPQGNITVGASWASSTASSLVVAVFR